MKKLIIGLLIVLFAVVIVSAAEVTEIRTFAWDMTNLDHVTQWEMEWGENAEGPFTSLGNIPYDGNPQPTFQAALEATVTGPSGTTQTRYFRLRTCGDVPQQDNTTVYECSTYSNIVPSDFWIPVGEFQVPVEFRIVAE